MVGYSLIRNKEKLAKMKTRCHSLSFVVPLVITLCTTHCHSLSFLVTHCTTCYHSLSLVAIWCATSLSFYQRSETIVLGKIDVRSRTILLDKRAKLKFPFNKIYYGKVLRTFVNISSITRSSCPEVSCRKAVVKIFEKFTGNIHGEVLWFYY